VPSPLERVATDRLVLRRPTADDAPLVLALLADPDGVRHNPSDALRTLEEAQHLVGRWQEQWDAGLGYWIVELDGAGVGVCGVKAVQLDGAPVWNLLYRLLPGARGRGVAREAAAEAVRRAREVDPDRPVIARIRAANAASARVAAAIGLERRPDLDADGEDGPDDVWATP
jgi:RimJ/RimL family protein N-acetyltransferase